MTNGSLLCGHKSSGDGPSIKSQVTESTAQNWSTQRAQASKSEVYMQIDTPPQLSHLVDSADEAKTVPTAYNIYPSYCEENPHLPNSSGAVDSFSTSAINFFMEMTLLKSALLPLRVTEFQLARCDPQ